MFKTCTKCKQSFPESEYTKSSSRKDGLSAWCRPCSKNACRKYRETLGSDKKAAAQEYQKEYRKNNIEKLKAYRKAHYAENRDRYLFEASGWAVKNPERRREVCRAYRESNQSALVNTRKKYRISRIDCPDYITRRACQSMLHRVLRLTGQDKEDRTEAMLGYTRSELVYSIERQFQEGMRWDNHGEWHIDHIIPVSELLRLGIKNPKRINALSNLRPLWAEANMKKHSRFELCHSDVVFLKASDCQ